MEVSLQQRTSDRWWTRHSKPTVCEDDLNWRWAALAVQCVCVWVWGGGGQCDISQQKHHSHWKGGWVGERGQECACACACVSDINTNPLESTLLTSRFSVWPSRIRWSARLVFVYFTVCPPSLRLHSSSLNFTLSYKMQPGTVNENVSSLLGATVIKVQLKSHSVIPFL